jgi:hypothetical protein
MGRLEDTQSFFKKSTKKLGRRCRGTVPWGLSVLPI